MIAVDYTITVGGSDWTDDVISIAVGDSLMRADAGEFTAYEKPDIGDEVVVSVNGTIVFRGYVARVRKTKSGAYHVTVFPKVARLKDRVIYLPKKYDGTDLATAVKEILSENLDGSTPWIVAPGSLPTGVTVSALRPMGTRLNALSAVVKSVPSGKASGHYEWYYNPVSDAVDVATYIGSETSVGTYTEDVDITLEVEPQEELYNRVIVVGNAGGDYTVYATADDTNSQSAYGIREKIVKTNRVLSTAEAQQLANALVKRYANPPVAGYASWLNPDDWPSIGLGDVITVVDSYGNSYTVRVSSRRWVLGDRFKFSVRFYSFADDSDLSRALAELASDYIAPSGAPNVFHQTKSDNFDASHPVVWRVHIPDDLDKTVRVYLSYKVSDFKAYSGSGNTAPVNDLDTDEIPVSGSTSSPSRIDDSGVRSNYSAYFKYLDADDCLIGSTTADTQWHYFYNSNDQSDWVYLPSETTGDVDYGIVTANISARVIGKASSSADLDNIPMVALYGVVRNEDKSYAIPTDYDTYYITHSYAPIISTSTVTMTNAFATISFVYPPEWAGDRITVGVRAVAFDYSYDSDFKIEIGAALAVTGFEKHTHTFSDNPKAKYDIPSLSVTNNAEITTAPLSGTVTVTIKDPENSTHEVYSGSAAEYTADVTNYVKPGWNTVTFSSTGKGFVDMVLEAKGRLKTFTNP